MSRRMWTWLGLTVLLLVGASPVHAQVSVLGKGWLLDTAGSLTSTAGELISGRNSIKSVHSGPDLFALFLLTDPNFIQFAPNQVYTITVSYRVLRATPDGFGLFFNSRTANATGIFGPGTVIRDIEGASRTETFRFTLQNYADYVLGFNVGRNGAIAIDDIRITDSAGQLVASENAEGPTIVPGPLNYQITDATVLLTEANSVVRSAAVQDLDGDRYPETILTFTAPRPSTTPLRPIVIEARGGMRVATSDFFPGGAPTVKHSPLTFFADINGDGLQDILFAEAGSDAPLWAGSVIGIGLNLGGGKYRNVSQLVPDDLQTTRSYALAAGDIDGDGRAEIVLPDEQTESGNNGSNTALLRWNGNGFDAQRNWIASSLWRSPTNLLHQSWMVLADLDKDGKQDLLVSGDAKSPNLRLVFGAAAGFTQAGLVTLPDGPWGHTSGSSNPPPVGRGADVGPVVVADFNNDGLPDIFAIEQEVLKYQPGVFDDPNHPGYEEIRANGGGVYRDITFQVFMNQGSRRFTDVASRSSAQNLGRTYYSVLTAIDMNLDGFVDVVAHYQTQLYARVASQWGTTVFLNDGTGAFQIVDGSLLFGVTTTPQRDGLRWTLGSFIPTVVTPGRTECIVYEPVGLCGGPGFCVVPRTNLYKVVANTSIGTGPGFVNSASLGVPGFNEFYYLDHYPDAAAAVEHGEYRSGLDHYLATGMSKGYQPRAPRAQ